jgi:hypothetical protein
MLPPVIDLRLFVALLVLVGLRGVRSNGSRGFEI